MVRLGRSRTEPSSSSLIIVFTMPQIQLNIHWTKESTKFTSMISSTPWKTLVYLIKLHRDSEGKVLYLPQTQLSSAHQNEYFSQWNTGNSVTKSICILGCHCLYRHSWIMKFKPCKARQNDSFFYSTVVETKV